MWYDAPFNEHAIRFLQSFASPFLDKFFILVTMTGEEMFFILFIAIVFWCVNETLDYSIAFSYFSGAVLNGFLKILFRVPRPIGEPGIRSIYLETANGYSFPSGHSQNSTLLWTYLMVNIRKKWLYVTGVVVIVLTGVSRLYLGVHRPVDVMGGIIVGLAWTFLTSYFFDRVGGKIKKILAVLFTFSVLSSLLVLETPAAYKFAGTVAAFCTGYIFKPMHTGCIKKVRMSIRIIRLVVGYGVLAGIRIFLGVILPVSVFGDFSMYFLMGLWVVIFAPKVFLKISGSGNTAAS